jgi:membrane peptidoglycan carboxypeptidase
MPPPLPTWGYTPCTEELDAPITINGWTARNYSRAYSNEPVTLRQALGQSLNTVPARIVQKLGVPAVIDYARRLGITGKLRPYPALCLGTEAISVYELLGAYATFANGGVWTLPRYVTHIEDRYGNVLHQFTPRRQEAMNADHAYMMTNLLQSGLGERGSARALGGYAMARNNEVGAKTGTTQHYADGWCVVLTQELATAVWFGGDDMRVHYRDANGTGSRTALPIAGAFMERAFADPAAGLKKGPFPPAPHAFGGPGLQPQPRAGGPQRLHPLRAPAQKRFAYQCGLRGGVLDQPGRQYFSKYMGIAAHPPLAVIPAGNQSSAKPIFLAYVMHGLSPRRFSAGMTARGG